MHDVEYNYMDWPEIEAVIYGEEASPLDLLKPRVTPDGILVQGFFPKAEQVEVVAGETAYPMKLQDEAGYYAVMLPGAELPDYHFRLKKADKTIEFLDPYRFSPQITETQEKAFCTGVAYRVYEFLGAHPMTVDGVAGTHFAVWAPNALRVSVVGDFCDWDSRRYLLHRRPMSGVFELFVPGVKAGCLYQYELQLNGRRILHKADPYAMVQSLTHPGMSQVAENPPFAWNDGEWMQARSAKCSGNAPVAIFETRLTDWESADALVEYVKDLGYTHVELHPIMEYQDEKSDGYNTIGYYAPTSRFGTPEDFKTLIDRLHQEEIGVLLDWTPAHFPQGESGLALFDGTPLYEVKDSSMAFHPMWKTMLYNYGSPMVRDFLIGNAFWWLEEFHADGLRLDDVDSMLYLDFGRSPGQWKANMYGTNENLEAVEFLKHLNSILKKRLPGVLLLAQEDGYWPELTDSVENDHLGFDYKWNKSWTEAILTYLKKPFEKRSLFYDQLTLPMLYAYCERYVLTLGCRDVGDAQTLAKTLPGDPAQQEAQVRLAYAYQMLHPGSMMSAPGSEAGEKLRVFLRDLHRLYRTTPALYALDDDPEGFEWIQIMSSKKNVIAFLRKSQETGETILAVLNFSDQAYLDYPVGVPFAGEYKEIFNTDQKIYGGGGCVNLGVKQSKPTPADVRPNSINLKIAPLSAAIFLGTPEE
jgi:1,4-alpha-glucan branching enzyme